MNASNASAAGFNTSEEDASDGAMVYDYEYISSVTCVDGSTGDAEAWVREAVRLLLSLAILLSNTFIVVAVLRLWTREGFPLGKSAASSVLILNLAAADALVGLSMVYSWIQDDVCYVYDRMALHPVSCMMGHLTTQFFDSASTVTVIAIAVDRVMSVSQTARCRNFLTTRRTVVVLCGVWFLGLFLALSVFMIPGAYSWTAERGCQLAEAYEESMLWVTVAVVLGVLFACYWRIHRVTLHMLRRGSLPAPRRQAGTKAARMLLVIFAWDACAYFPLLIVTVLKACGVHVHDVLRDICANLTLLVFLADPFIYAYHNQHTKRAIVDLARCLRREPAQEQPSSRRESFPGTSLRRFRQIISTITNSSSASDEEKPNRQSPTANKRNSLTGAGEAKR